MTRILFFSLLIGLFFSACQSGTNNNEATTSATVEANKASDKSNQSSTAERLLKSANGNAEVAKVAEGISSVIGSNMISTIDFSNGQLTLNYFGSADDYNTALANEKQKMNAGSFEQYWNTGSRAEKTFCSAAGEVLKNHEFVKSVKVVLPTGKQSMNGMVDRDGLSKITGKSWKELVADWDVQFTNGIVRIPAGRAKFMKAFMD
ncbi:MAG: hypothetical protein ACI8YQ_003106 [Polaribacter sp.]|jgi:hypothetical protein